MLIDQYFMITEQRNINKNKETKNLHRSKGLFTQAQNYQRNA